MFSTERLWTFPEPLDARMVRTLYETLRVPRFVAELLARRGFHDPAEAALFLAPALKTLSDPFLLTNMEALVDRILVAVDRRERIVLYGDYDVDGVSSLALMTRVLRPYGVEPGRFLPSRMDEGYGLSADGIARCVAECAPQLLIALDCGTSSATEIAALQAQGVDVLVIDHHEVKGAPPPCPLVNPKLGDDFHYFCTVGLVFKTAHALLKRRPLKGFDLREHLDLVALGTVADLVPLRGENRVLVRRGLEQLERTHWIGLKALIEVASLRAPFRPGSVGFSLGPRLNAAGRLGTAQDALELLLTDDPKRARVLANALDAQNRERRAVEDSVLRLAEAQVAEWFDATRDAAIVAGAPGWHPGVVGIVASRLQKRFHRPTVVIGFEETGLGKGSARSIDGLSMVKALEQCGEHLVKFGGHAAAAGLTIEHACFEQFREDFRQRTRELVGATMLQPRLRLDVELTLGEIDFDLLHQHDALHPFGMGHAQPVFFARGVTLAAEPRVMKEKHFSFQLRQGGDDYRAVWFGAAATETLPRLPWDVAFTIERDDWNGNVTPQMQIKAVRSAV